MDSPCRTALGRDARGNMTKTIRRYPPARGNPFERGVYLSRGRGSQVDLVEAHKWFNIAAAGGDRAAAQHRDELASEMSREEAAALGFPLTDLERSR